MDVSLLVSLKVYELYCAPIRISAISQTKIQDTAVAHLCPCNIRRDKEFNVSIAENAQDWAPKVPVHQPAPSFEQFRGGFLLARLVFAPRKAAVTTCVLLFDIALHVSRALIRGKAREHKYGFDAQFFERPEVALDTRCQSERKTARSCEEGFARWWTVVERLEVVGGIDTEAGVGQDAERERLEVLPLLKVCWWRLENMVTRARAG
jgi:hypothetical protein